MASSSSTSSLLRKQTVAPVLNVCVWCARLWLGIRKRVGPGTIVPGPTLSVLWRCPTLPHPPRCSTIGACGLSFQVRNGGWAFPRGYDHHKMSQPVFTLSPVVVLGVVLVVIRIVATSILRCLSTIRCIRMWLMIVVSVGPLVPVGSRAPRGASTSGLSTR